jgi:hypothetical protein
MIWMGWSTALAACSWLTLIGGAIWGIVHLARRRIRSPVQAAEPPMTAMRARKTAPRR